MAHRFPKTIILPFKMGNIKSRILSKMKVFKTKVILNKQIWMILVVVRNIIHLEKTIKIIPVVNWLTESNWEMT